MPPGVPNPRAELAAQNREQIAQALLLVETWMLDAYAKHQFHGDVNVCFTYADGRVVLMKPSIEQKVKVA